ncbi:MAG: rRNA maturation RNase YbeY [Kiritimatiellae bacterium]|nr:rRNA maturation RNase YbeY [Kiritimatiellia bacterium]MDD4735846.1 rRNA maturation RNase YbeY [Kiritimatiellia bacterium]
MKTEVRNQQNKQTINLRAIRTFLSAMATRVDREDPDTHWKDISLILMDDEGISAVNRTFFGKSAPTDVISFRYAPTPEDGGRISGEVLVNVQRAHEEGLRRNQRDYELAFYIAHGCLHLTGADDATPPTRASMHRRQNAWIREVTPSISLTFFTKPQ